VDHPAARCGTAPEAHRSRRDAISKMAFEIHPPVKDADDLDAALGAQAVE
jgi:hypothetical protein